MSSEIVQAEKNTLNTETTFQNKPVNFGQYQLASRFKRWLANVINVLIFYVSLIIAGLFSTSSIEEDISILPLLFILANIVLQIWSIHTYKQTIGKRLLKLQVIGYKTTEPLSDGRYIGRELIDWILGVTSIGILISAIVAFVNDERRSLTDLMCSTIVVKKA